MTRNVAALGLGAPGPPIAERLATVFNVTGYDLPARSGRRTRGRSARRPQIALVSAVEVADAVLRVVRIRAGRFPPRLGGLA
jgi:3-hydroxyisobutyrate dehydrogenase-like beta-hydroxyacid dehydrogenase